MASTYKLGDKTFKSTGDVEQDIALINKNFPEVDTGALRESLKPKAALPTNFAVRLPAVAASKSEDRMTRATDLAGQYDKKQLDALDKAANISKTMNKDLPTDFVNKMGAYDTTFELLKEIAKTKNSGFVGKGGKPEPVDTGFFANMIPNNASAWYARHMEHMDPVHASARRTLNQQIKAAVNPVRKEITGAAAPQQEIAEWIAPLMPSGSDDDDPFNTTLIEAARQLVTKKRSEINAHRTAGYDVPDTYDLEGRLSELMGVVPKKYQINAPKAPGAQ